MGKGKTIAKNTETSEWIHNTPGSVWYITLDYVCKRK